jgi:hypothetical protein
MRVENRVQEPDWFLADCEAFLVQQRDDTTYNWRTGTGAADAVGVVKVDGGYLETDGGDVGEAACATGVVVNVAAVFRRVVLEVMVCCLWEWCQDMTWEWRKT